MYMLLKLRKTLYAGVYHDVDYDYKIKINKKIAE